MNAEIINKIYMIFTWCDKYENTEGMKKNKGR